MDSLDTSRIDTYQRHIDQRQFELTLQTKGPLFNAVLQFAPTADNRSRVIGYFDVGHSGSLCAHELCARLRFCNIRFKSIPRKAPSPQTDIARRLANDMFDLARVSLGSALQLNMTSLNMPGVSEYMKCAHVCRYDISRGDKGCCEGLELARAHDRDLFLKHGGVLYQLNRLKGTVLTGDLDSGCSFYKSAFTKGSTRYALRQLGIRYAELPDKWRGSRFKISDEPSLIACILSGAKAPNLHALLEKHHCNLPPSW